MNIDWSSLYQIVLALGVIAGLILSIYNMRPNRENVESQTGKNTAESGKIAAESADLLLEPLNSRIKALESQVVTLTEKEAAHASENTELKAKMFSQQTEIDELRGGVTVLVAQLEGAGLIPRYKPKPKTEPLGTRA